MDVTSVCFPLQSQRENCDKSHLGGAKVEFNLVPWNSSLQSFLLADSLPTRELGPPSASCGREEKVDLVKFPASDLETPG